MIHRFFRIALLLCAWCLLEFSLAQSQLAPELGNPNYTHEEKLAWEKAGKQLEEALEEGDSELFDRLFDYPGFMRRVFLERDEFGKNLDYLQAQLSFSNAIRAGDQWGGIFYSLTKPPMAEGVAFRFLGLRFAEDGSVWAIIRAIFDPEDQGYNYYGFRVGQNQDNALKFDDVYNASAGEFISQTSRALLLPILLDLAQSHENAEQLSRRILGGKEPQDALEFRVEDYESFAQLGLLLANGEVEKSLQSLRSLSADWKNEKIYALMLYQIASHIEDEQSELMLEALQLLDNKHNENGNLDFMLVDYDFLRSDFEGTLARIKRIQEWLGVGNDISLEVMRSGVYLTQEDYAAAIASFERIWRSGDEQFDLDSYRENWLLYTLLLGDHKQGRLTLEEYNRESPEEWRYVPADFLREDAADFLREFIQSEAGQGWLVEQDEYSELF